MLKHVAFFDLIPQPDPADPNAELPPPTQISYVSVSVSEPQAALNLYTDKYCQLLASAAVGLWNNTALTANITSLRWEGTAPASMTPGTLSPNQFPPGVKAQPKTKGPKIEDKWVMDPSKGRIVVGLVAAVMAVGVAIGVYQVYKAAQYVPPPKKYSAVSAGAVGVRKVKRQDAYFKKPVREPMVSAPSTPNMSGLGTANSSPRVSRFEASSRSPLSNHSGQLRHERIPTLAPIASSGGQMDWGTGRRMNGSNQSAGTDAVLIDMQETATFRRPWISGGNGYGQGGSSTGGSSSSAGGMTDLMQFTQDSPTHSVYQSASSTQLSSAYSRGQAHQQTPLAARGGADVLLPAALMTKSKNGTTFKRACLRDSTAMTNNTHSTPTVDPDYMVPPLMGASRVAHNRYLNFVDTGTREWEVIGEQNGLCIMIMTYNLLANSQAIKESGKYKGV
ncbi:hypothetical protein BGX28_001067 [Mortierella sp. GBA30]|nr:hypothetical protein BGX28_001067 [Mortierella sp. GBA30]